MLGFVLNHLPYVGAVRAFFAELGFLSIAVVLVVGGVALRVWNPLAVNSWPALGKLKVLASWGLVVAGLMVGAYTQGYRARGALDQTERLTAALAREQQIRAQRELDLSAMNEITAALGQSALVSKQKAESLQGKVADYERILEARERAVADRAKGCPVPADRFDERDVRELRSLAPGYFRK